MKFSNGFVRGWIRALLALVLFSLGISASAQVVNLGTAATYGVIGASTVTNTGATLITGNLALSPGTSVTGFPPGIITGSRDVANANALQAQNDVTTAYNFLASQPCGTTLSGDLGGRTLVPGVYCFSSSALLTGTLTLDAQGNTGAVFIFQIGSSLTTASGSSVVMINGGSSCNLWWQVGSAAVLGTGSSFTGNILALTSVTLNTGAGLSGRAFARTGAVTLDSNAVAVCLAPLTCPVITVNPAILPPAVIGTPYLQTITASGSSAVPITFSVTSGALPAGLSLNSATGVLSGTATTAGTSNFTITARDANGCTGLRAYTMIIAPLIPSCPTITVNPATLPGGSIGSAYSQTLSASGSTNPPVTFSITSGSLPVGLTLSPAGAITGVPTTAGTASFTVTATDTAACPGSRPYTIIITVLTCPVITLSPATLLPGTAGIAYSQSVTASGTASLPVTFSVSSGSLPTGLSLNASTGAITGVPTTPGTFNFSLTARDTATCAGLQPYSITIAPALVVVFAGPAEVPTLSEWAMILLVLLVAFFGFTALRRQGR